MPTNSHIPLSSNDIAGEAVLVPGASLVAAQAGNPTTDANGTTYAPQVVDLSSTGEQTIALPAGRSANTIVKASPGRLGRILVTTSGTNALLLYDNASAPSGTIIGVVAASAPLGLVESGFPAANGITVAGNASNPGVTISFV